jgi:hypothetical protein
MAGYMQWTVGKHMALQVTDKYCEHVSEWVIIFSGTTVMWDILVITDQTILTTNLIQHSMIKKEETCQLIDIAIPDDSNVNTIEAEKLSKYKELEIEVSRIWNVRTKIVLIIIAALGTIKNGFD